MAMDKHTQRKASCLLDTFINTHKPFGRDILSTVDSFIDLLKLNGIRIDDDSFMLGATFAISCALEREK